MKKPAALWAAGFWGFAQSKAGGLPAKDQKLW
jgi:hypothetical protein